MSSTRSRNNPNAFPKEVFRQTKALTLPSSKKSKQSDICNVDIRDISDKLCVSIRSSASSLSDDSIDSIDLDVLAQYDFAQSGRATVVTRDSQTESSQSLDGTQKAIEKILLGCPLDLNPEMDVEIRLEENVKKAVFDEGRGFNVDQPESRDFHEPSSQPVREAPNPKTIAESVHHEPNNSQEIHHLLVEAESKVPKVNSLQCPFCKLIFEKSQHINSHVGSHKGFNPSADWLNATNRTKCQKCKKIVDKKTENKFGTGHYHTKCRPQITPTPKKKKKTYIIQNQPSKATTVVRPFSTMKGVQKAAPNVPEQLDIPSLKEIFKINISTKSYIPAVVASNVAKALIFALNQVTEKNDLESWSQLFALPKCLFHIKGVDQEHKYSDVLKNRTEAFLLGQWAILWRKAISENSGPLIISQFSKNWKGIVIQKAEQGNISSAFKALSSSSLSKPTKETFDKLKVLHPNVEEFKGILDFQMKKIEISCQEVNIDKTLGTFPNGTAPGPDGLRVQHLLDILRLNTAKSAQDPRGAMHKFVHLVINGKALDYVGQFFSSARLIPIEKKDTDAVRPIAIGCVWRRLIAKMILRTVTEDAVKIIEPEQFGVANKHGIEKVVHAVRTANFLNKNNSQDIGILSVDLTNAFNKISRSRFLQIVMKKLPKLYQFVAFCYCHGPKLYIQNFIDEIQSENGAQQGDPCAPLLFSLVLDELVKEITKQFPSVKSFWYLDDGNIIGDVKTLALIVRFIEEKGPTSGLFLNRKKCNLFFTNADKKYIKDNFEKILPEGIHIQYDGIKVLGVPIGKDSFIKDNLIKNLEKFKQPIQKLTKLDDAQVAFKLLSNCMGLCSVNYHLRCTPPSLTSDLAKQYDDMILDTLSKIIGIIPTKNQIDQIHLPCKMGGLGLKNAEKHREAAFISSFNSTEAFLTLMFAQEELNSMIEFLLEDVKYFDNNMNIALSKCQKVVSEDIDKQSHKILLFNSSEKDKARLLSTAGNQMSLILNADLGIPRGFRLNNQEFQTFIQHNLGMNISNSNEKCRHCYVDLDTKGFHCLTCKRGEYGPIQRHNAVRNILFKFCQKAVLNPRLEVPLRSGSKLTPADIFIPIGDNGKPVALDITICHPQAVSVVKDAAGETGFANKIATSKKMKKHDVGCVKEGIKFIPFAMEIFGKLAPTARNIVEQIATAIANRTNSKKSTILDEIQRKILFCLVRGINGAITSRSPGRATF